VNEGHACSASAAHVQAATRTWSPSRATEVPFTLVGGQTGQRAAAVVRNMDLERPVAEVRQDELDELVPRDNANINAEIVLELCPP
jgi:hypothetical protein